MSRRRPTEVSWDSDDDLLKDQPSVSAFPDKTRGDADDIDDIDINALLGYEEDDDLLSEKSASSTKKTEVSEKAKKTSQNAITKKATTVNVNKVKSAPAKSNIITSSSTKTTTGKVPSKINSEKSDVSSKKTTEVKQNSGKKTPSSKASSSSVSSLSSVKADSKPKKKIEPIVFDLPDIEQPAEDLIVLDVEETLDFEYEGEDNLNDYVPETASTQSQYSSLSVTVEKTPEHDVSIQDSTLNDEEPSYQVQESSEESDSDGEDSRRGRFKSERKNVITIKTVKKEKGSIPDTLEISQEQQAELDEFYHHGKGGRQRGRGRGGMAGRLGPRPGFQQHQRNAQPVTMATAPAQHIQPQNQQPPNPLPYPQGQSQPDYKPRNIHINPRFRPPNPQVNTSVPMPPHELMSQQPAPHPTYSGPSVVQQGPQPLMMQPVRMPGQMAPPHQQVERWPPPTSQPQPMPMYPGNRPPTQGQFIPNSQPYPVHNHPPSSGPMMAAPGGPPPHQHYNQGQMMQGPAPQPGPYFQNGPPGQRGPQPLLQAPQRPPPLMQLGGRPPYQGGPPQQFVPHNNQFGPGPQPQMGRPIGPPHQHPQPMIGQHPGGPHPGGQHPGGPHPGGQHQGGPHPGGQHQGGPHPGGQHQGGPHPGGQHPGGQFRGPGQHQFQQSPQQQQHKQQHPQQHGQQPQRFQQHPQHSPVRGMGPQFKHPGAHNQPRLGNQQNPSPQRPSQQHRAPPPQRFQGQRQQLSEVQKAARLAHTKKLQERARKFQMNKLQQGQGQPIQVVGGGARKRPSFEDSSEVVPIKQVKEEPMPIKTEPIDVDPETKRKMDEQARLREKIRRQKELNRQKAAESRKKELEERLAKEGKTLADIQTPPPVAKQPQPGQLQAGPIRNAGKNFQCQGQQQNQFKVQQSASFQRQNQVQPQNVQVKQQGVKRTMSDVQGQSSRPNSAIIQDGPTGGKVMKKVTIVKRNKNGEVISSEIKFVPINEDVTKKSAGQVAAKVQGIGAGGQIPSGQNAAKVQNPGGQMSNPGVQNAVANNKKIVLNKPNIGANTGNKIVLRKDPGNRPGFNQPSALNRSVVLKGQGQGVKLQGGPATRKVIAHQGMTDQAGRRVVMSGDSKPRMVLIKNLSTSTSEDSVHHMCTVVGPVETLQIDQSMKQAKVTFINSLHAEMFQKKYNRRMLDLSHITVDLLTI